MQKYLTSYNHSNGITNERFYRDFYDFEFIAENDQDALNKVKAFQKECENNQENSGIELCAYDPLLVLYKYNPDDDEFNFLIEE